MQAVLALDAGGSKCDALLVDSDGQILGYGHRNTPGVGGRSSSEVLRAAAGAFKEHRRFERLILSCVGSNLSTNLFSLFKADNVQVQTCDEASVALAQAGHRHGVVLLAGTGAFACGVLPDGRVSHLDGWGPILADFGSGHSIGLMGLRALTRCDWHPRHQTSMRDPILERLGVRDPGNLHRLNLFMQDRSVVASLARIVSEEAEKGDAVARNVMREAATNLSETFRDVVSNLEIGEAEFPAVGTGSVIRNSDYYWETLVAKLREIAPGCAPVRLRERPVMGVTLLGLRLLNHGDPPPEVVARLRRDYEAVSRKGLQTQVFTHPPVAATASPHAQGKASP